REDAPHPEPGAAARLVERDRTAVAAPQHLEQAIARERAERIAHAHERVAALDAIADLARALGWHLDVLGAWHGLLEEAGLDRRIVQRVHHELFSDLVNRRERARGQAMAREELVHAFEALLALARAREQRDAADS